MRLNVVMRTFMGLASTDEMMMPQAAQSGPDTMTAKRIIAKNERADSMNLFFIIFED
jgi:hypothetical protein